MDKTKALEPQSGKDVATLLADALRDLIEAISLSDFGYEDFIIEAKIRGDKVLAAYDAHPAESNEIAAMEAVMETIDPAIWPGLTIAHRAALGRFAKPAEAATLENELLEALCEAYNREDYRYFPHGNPPYDQADYIYSIEEAGANARLKRWEKVISDYRLSTHQRRIVKTPHRQGETTNGPDQRPAQEKVAQPPTAIEAV